MLRILILCPTGERNRLSPVEERCPPLQHRTFVPELLRGKGAICWSVSVRKQCISQDTPIKSILYSKIFKHLHLNHLRIGLLNIWIRTQSLNTRWPFAEVYLVRNVLSLSSVPFPVYLLYMLLGLRHLFLFSFRIRTAGISKRSNGSLQLMCASWYRQYIRKYH